MDAQRDYERLLKKEAAYEREPTQHDVNEKLFEAIKLINEKIEQKVREQKTDNKRVELAIDVMGSRYYHDKDIVTSRLNAISAQEEETLGRFDGIERELGHTMGRLNNMEQVLEAIEFVQSNKKCCK